MTRLVLPLMVIFGSVATAEGEVRLGIFGTVDRIAPLTVAGREMLVPADLPVISPLGPGQRVMPGDTLAVVVAMRDGGLVATRVLEIYPVAGPVTRTDGASATVMGSAVYLPSGTAVTVGDWVAVSGLWSGHKVITTRLRPLEDSGFAQLTAAFEMPTGDGASRLGGTEITGYKQPEGDPDRDVWMLSGQPEGESLRVRLAARGVFGGDVDLALWQGYTTHPVASETYMLHGTAVTGTAREAQMPAPGTLVTRCAVRGKIVSVAPAALEDAFAALGCATRTPAD